jgi:prepilin peptidase CpaA
MPELEPGIRIALIALVMAAAAYDFRFRRVPNWLNLSGLILGFGLNLYYYAGHGALRAAEGMLLAFAVYLPFYLLKGMGAGDVKLMAAVGSLAGPMGWFYIFVITAIFGGVAGIILSLVKGRFYQTCMNVGFLLNDFVHLRAPYKANPEIDVRNRSALRMPHAIAIAAGTLLALSVKSLL